MWIYKWIEDLSWRYPNCLQLPCSRKNVVFSFYRSHVWSASWVVSEGLSYSVANTADVLSAYSFTHIVPACWCALQKYASFNLHFVTAYRSYRSHIFVSMSQDFPFPYNYITCDSTDIFRCLHRRTEKRRVLDEKFRTGCYGNRCSKLNLRIQIYVQSERTLSWQRQRSDVEHADRRTCRRTQLQLWDRCRKVKVFHKWIAENFEYDF